MSCTRQRARCATAAQRALQHSICGTGKRRRPPSTLRFKIRIQTTATTRRDTSPSWTRARAHSEPRLAIPRPRPATHSPSLVKAGTTETLAKTGTCHRSPNVCSAAPSTSSSAPASPCRRPSAKTRMIKSTYVFASPPASLTRTVRDLGKRCRQHNQDWLFPRPRPEQD